MDRSPFSPTPDLRLYSRNPMAVAKCRNHLSHELNMPLLPLTRYSFADEEVYTSKLPSTAEQGNMGPDEE